MIENYSIFEPKVDSLIIVCNRKLLKHDALLYLGLFIILLVTAPYVMSKPSTPAYIAGLGLGLIIYFLIKSVSSYIRYKNNMPELIFQNKLLVVKDFHHSLEIDKSNISAITYKMDDEPLETKVVYEKMIIHYNIHDTPFEKKINIDNLEWTNDYAIWIDNWLENSQSSNDKK